MLIVPAVVMAAVWVSICAAAPEFLWQGLRLALGHVSRTELLAALLIGVVLAFFIEPLMERLRALLSRADHPHAPPDRLHDALFTAGLSLAFALTSVFLHEAMTAFVNPQLKLHMAFWESELSKSEWFAGDAFTAADIQMSFPLEAAAARGGLDQGHPKAMAFLDRIHARPTYQRALEKGGPYTVGR